MFRKKVLEESQNQRITDFFPVRRSNRKTSKQIEVRLCLLLIVHATNSWISSILSLYLGFLLARSINHLLYFQEEVNCQMEEQILTGCNEKLLEVYSCPVSCHMRLRWLSVLTVI